MIQRFRIHFIIKAKGIDPVSFRTEAYAATHKAAVRKAIRYLNSQPLEEIEILSHQSEMVP